MLPSSFVVSSSPTLWRPRGGKPKPSLTKSLRYEFRAAALPPSLSLLSCHSVRTRALRRRQGGKRSCFFGARLDDTWQVLQHKYLIVQNWAKDRALGCVKPASCLPLAAGNMFTQPRVPLFRPSLYSRLTMLLLFFRFPNLNSTMEEAHHHHGHAHDHHDHHDHEPHQVRDIAGTDLKSRVRRNVANSVAQIPHSLYGYEITFRNHANVSNVIFTHH